MQASLKRLTPLWLALGLGGLALAGLIALFQRRFDTYAQASLAVGLVGFALALLLNPAEVQTWMGGRQARYGGNVALMTAAFLAILVMVNWLIYQNPQRWDLTEDQTNTLAPETLQALEQLPEPVQAIGFYSTSFAGAQRSAEDLLESYRVRAKGKFSYEFHDPRGEPALARAYNITRDGTIILVMGDQQEELNFATEQEITGALVRFSHPSKRGIYFLTGHGEKDIAAAGDNSLAGVVDLLTKQNYAVQPLNLQVTTTVPSDARAIVIAGPLVPVTADEVATLSNYLKSNPNTALIVMLDPLVQTETTEGTAEPLVDYLKTDWGINLPQDVIFDLSNSLPQQPFFPVNFGYEPSPITDKLQNIATAFPVARSVVISGTAETFPGITYTPLVKTDEGAWGETNMESLATGELPTLDEGDHPGPLNIAVAAENQTTKTRLVVFGDSDFPSDTNLAGQRLFELGANANLFVNSVNWATVEESLINLALKTPTSRTLELVDDTTILMVGLFTIGIMPIAVLVLGGVVWFLRRRHA
jgi:ABC-type uncharacterized transport system involved in gliding motility auxiliary subunit